MSAKEQANEIKLLLKQHNTQTLSANDDATRLDKIRRIFTKLAPELNHSKSSSNNNSSSSQQQFKIWWSQWLQKHHNIFLNQLCHRIRPVIEAEAEGNLTNTEQSAGKRYALRVSFGVLTYIHVPTSTKQRSCFMDEHVMYRLVSALCGIDVLRCFGTRIATPSSTANTCSSNKIGIIEDGMLQMLRTEFILPYHDVRYFMLLALTRLAKEINEDDDTHDDDDDKRNAVENIMRLLLSITIASNEEELLLDDAYLVTPTSSMPSDDDSSSDESNDSSSDSDDNESSESDDDDDSERNENECGKRTAARHDSHNKRQKQSGLCTVQRLSRHKRVLGLAWINALQMSSYIEPSTHKRVLQFLSKEVISVVHSPLRLADYFTESYEYGGITSLLALNGLFQLMTDYGLEYPQFYASLYSLIDTQAFYAKHRGRFFKLLSVCLSSTLMLPAYIVAAFCKRLCRSALTAPPSGALFVLALISNLLRKHKACQVLIYRDEESSVAMEDPYDNTTNDPAESRALESSLWEIESLEKHYHPTVATFAKSVGKEVDSKIPLYDMDEFLVHTYKSLFDQENTERKLKKGKGQVPLAFKEPSGLFTENDIFHGIVMQ